MRARVIFAVLTVAVGSFTLLQSMVVPVLTTVQQELGTDQATVTWVLTAYLLSASIWTPIVGRLGDVWGKQRMLVAALVALSLGSAMAALSTSIGWLIAARVIQGVGGGVMPLAFGIIRDEFAPRHRATAISVIASLGAAGFGIGIVVSGPIVETLGYTWLFWLPAIATAIAAVGAWRFVPSSPSGAPVRLPVLPAVLLAGWLVPLLLGISRGNEWGWGSPLVLGLFALAALMVAVWVRVEHRAPVPMIDLQMMRRRGVWTTNLVSGCVGFGMFAAFGFLPQFLQTPEAAGYGFGASVTESGLFIAPSALASFLIGFITGWLVQRIGPRPVIVTGSVLNSAAFAGLALFHDHAAQIYFWTTLQGIGGGLVFSSIAGVVVAAVPAHQTGVAGGMNMNIRTIGGSLGTAVMAGIVTGHLGAAGLPAEAGYTIGFGLLAAAMLVASAVALLIPDLRQPSADPPAVVRDDESGGLGAGLALKS